MASKVGNMMKAARTNAGLTQAKLAKKVGAGLTAEGISKAERGELDLSTTVLKKIAVATGVTQASLVNAAKGTEKASKSTSKTSTKSTTKKNNKAAKITSAITTGLRLTAAEKKLVEYYRSSDSDTRKAATKVLKGESSDLVSTLLNATKSAGGKTGDSGISVVDMIGDALEGLLGGK